MTMNARIALLRQKEGLSQKIFGQLINKTVSYVCKIESGKMQPTDEVVRMISDTFGVDKSWLTEGKGVLVVTSLPERIRIARKARNYTQDELAELLKYSRNTISLIERGEARPGEDLIQTLVDELWINKTWLLTGQGRMEKKELTQFYEILKADPSVRQHIKKYIEHLDRQDSFRPLQAILADEENDSDNSRRMESGKADTDASDQMIIAPVNDVNAARLFFNEFNIPYEEITEGPDAGKLRIREPRSSDKMKVLEVERRCRRSRISEICDHANVFRDKDDNTIVTFNPYEVEHVSKGKAWIEISDHSIYGYGTKAFVVKC